jgi:MoxR-like ATPase
LPEAQLDRFLFKVLVGYPEPEEEVKILDTIENEEKISLEKVVSKEKIIQLQEQITQVYVSEKIKDYIIRLVKKTREKDSRILY